MDRVRLHRAGYGMSDANAYGYADTYSNSDAYGYADTYPNGYAYSNSDANGHPHRRRERGHGNAVVHPHGNTVVHHHWWGVRDHHPGHRGRTDVV